MNAKVTKTTSQTTSPSRTISATPKLDYSDQPLGTDVIIFTTKCERTIEVQMQSVLDYITIAKLNVSYEMMENPFREYDACEEEIVIDAAQYLDDNFNHVCQMYFDQVVVFTIQEASNFIQGYTSALVRQNLPVDEVAITNIMSHVRNQYGISMEVA